MKKEADWLELGYVSGAHGIRGEIKLKLQTDDLQLWSRMELINFRDSAGKISSFRVLSSRIHKDQLLVVLDGIVDRSSAESMRGSVVVSPKSELPALENEDDWYYYQLIGLTGIDINSGEPIGLVKNVFSAGANEVLELERTGDSRTVNVPFIKDAVGKVDLDSGSIELNPVYLSE